MGAQILFYLVKRHYCGKELIIITRFYSLTFYATDASQLKCLFQILFEKVISCRIINNTLAPCKSQLRPSSPVAYLLDSHITSQ
jgi:hypothetical protein